MWIINYDDDDDDDDVVLSQMTHRVMTCQLLHECKFVSLGNSLPVKRISAVWALP